MFSFRSKCPLNVSCRNLRPEVEMDKSSGIASIEATSESASKIRAPKKARKVKKKKAHPAPAKRTQRPFPASSFEEPLEFAKAIFAFGSGQPVRRFTLFDSLKKSPESGASRQLITNAGKSEIANQVRRALENADAVDTPISIYFPNLKVEIGTN